MLLQGKSGIITGATRGMGRVAAELFISEGARVLCAAPQSSAVQDLTRQLGSNAIGIRLDIASRNSCQQAVEAATEAFGRVDFLVNFAGVWDGRNTAEIDDSHWDQIINVNLKGAFQICQAIAPTMIRQQSGRIVLIGSVAARAGGEVGGPHYAASKGGVISLTRSLARRLGAHNVTVNTISPGPVETDMIQSWAPALKERLAQAAPLGRIGQPIDIARVALFFVSDLSAWVTGQTLEVNGGILFS